MFVLTKISDTIRLEPSELERPTREALTDVINKKYANRVVHNVGLCICLYDIESLGDGLIKPGDGAVFVKTVFRVIVFRPFVGEVLVGWVSSCTEEGLNDWFNMSRIQGFCSLESSDTVKMEFFDDIHIPKSMLFENCSFVAREQAWVWKTPDADLYIDTNEKIRFRVEQEIFNLHTPRRPTGVEEEQLSSQEPPYSIIASCQVDGMGLVSWWE